MKEHLIELKKIVETEIVLNDNIVRADAIRNSEYRAKATELVIEFYSSDARIVKPIIEMWFYASAKARYIDVYFNNDANLIVSCDFAKCIKCTDKSHGNLKHIRTFKECDFEYACMCLQSVIDIYAPVIENTDMSDMYFQLFSVADEVKTITDKSKQTNKRKSKKDNA